MPTTFRSDVAAGLLTILDAFAAAHPTLLRATFRARPTSMVNDLPYAYISGRRETIAHTQGTRERVMNPEVVYVSQLSDVTADMDNLDDAVDLLVDHFTDYPHITANTIWDRMIVLDDLEDLPDGTYRLAARFQFQNIGIREGRP